MRPRNSCESQRWYRPNVSRKLPDVSRVSGGLSDVSGRSQEVLLAAERPVRPLVMALLFGRLVEAHCLRYRELATHSVAMATGKAEPRVLHGSGCLTRGRLSSEEVSGQGARSLVVFLLKPAASAPLPSSTRSTVQEHPSNRPHPLCTPVCVSASVSSPLAQHEE